MTDFFDIAVTPSVLALQKQKGSLGMYTDAAGAGPGDPHTITQQEAELILTRDSIYMATVGENGLAVPSTQGWRSRLHKDPRRTHHWVGRT